MQKIDFSFRAERAAERVVDVIASTEAVDSYRTILRGWDLARFQRNPVILWNHRRDLSIGSAERVRVEGGALRMAIRFVDAAANPLAEQVHEGVRQKSIRGVSVGFGPTTRTTVREELRDGVPVDVFEGLELLEVSLCPVPSNPEAVVETMRSLRSIAAPELTTGALEGFVSVRPKATDAEIARHFRTTPLDVAKIRSLAHAERWGARVFGRELEDVRARPASDEPTAEEAWAMKVFGRSLEQVRAAAKAAG